MKPAIRKALGYVLAIIFVILCWWGLAVWISSPALPTPANAFSAFIKAIPELIPHTWISGLRIAAGMAIGMALAMPIGLAAGRSSRFGMVANPVINLLYPIPKVVFLPVLIVLLGLYNAPKIALIAIMIFFQTLVTARDAAAGIPETYLGAVKAMGASRWQQAWQVVLPASLPAVFTAMRINVGTAIAVLFLAESFAGSNGLGYYINNEWSMFQYSKMFAGIIAMAILGMIIYEVMGLVERYLLRWQQA
jgi:NitT/TauT family transport system permease protein